MSLSVNNYIKEKVSQRMQADNFRELRVKQGLVDFYSNDYLGFARNSTIATAAEHSLLFATQTNKQGSTGSRLLSGNSAFIEGLEVQLAQFHCAENALLFNSGYDANVGVLAAIPYKNAVVIYDELVHASMHDGMRLSKAKKIAFAHNDINDLEIKLKAADGLKFIAVEALYSMDGDEAPLAEIVAMAKKYDAAIVLDEAHSTGIIGLKGEGKAQAEQLHKDIFIRIHTFGKAIGAHGAVVLCNSATKDFLVNYCRPFIFSTAAPIHSLAVIKAAYEYLPWANEERSKLQQNIKHFRQLLNNSSHFQLLSSNSPIQCIVKQGNAEVKRLAATVQQAGYDARAILSPTVPVGKERIRVCVHSFNTSQDIEGLCDALLSYND